MKYYVVTDVYGPISKDLGEHETIEQAVEAYNALPLDETGRDWIDGCSTDIEDDFSFNGADMDSSKFAQKLESLGFEHCVEIDRNYDIWRVT